MTNNFGAINAPTLVYSPFGDAGKRGTLGVVAINSSAIYEGSFVSIMDAIGTSLAEGCRAMADDDFILGVAQSFSKPGSSLPIKTSEDGGAGSITAPTGIYPLKYTFAASNGRADAARKLEMVNVLPILPLDIWEVTLTVAAGTSLGVRGTTTGSDLEGYTLAVNANTPFTLDETSATLTPDNMDAIIVSLNGKFPANPNRVYVQFLRAQCNVTAAA